MLNQAAKVFSLRVLVAIAAFLTDIVIARLLGPEYKGYYYVMMLVPVLVSVLGIAGQDYVIAARARLGDGDFRDSLWRGLIISASLAAVAGLLLIFLPMGVVFPDVPASLGVSRWASGFLVLAEALFAVIGMYLLAQGRAIRYAGMRVLRRGIVLIAALCLLWIDASLSAGVAWLLWFLGGSAIASLLLIGKIRIPPINRVGSGYRQQIQEGFIALPGRIGERGQMRISPIMLGVFAAGAPVGYLSVAMGFGELLYFVSGSLAFMLFGSDRDRKRQWQIVRIAVPILTILAIATGLVVQILVPIFYGQAFAPSIGLVWLIVPGTLAMSVAHVIVPFIVREDRLRDVSRSYVLSVITTVVGCMILVPRFLAAGAAIASSIGSFVLLVSAVRCLSDGGPGFANLIPVREDLDFVRKHIVRSINSFHAK